MRKSAVSSQRHHSLFSFIRHPTEAQNVKPTDLTNRHAFYRDFLQACKLKFCQIHGVEIEGGRAFSRSYALYVIRVETVDTQYEIRRRFSDFLNFYASSQANHLNLDFPCKTFLMPGWCEGVTRKRKNQFNEFIRHIIETERNQEIKFSFFQFIELYEHYQDQGILQFCRAKSAEPQISITDEELLEKVVILNHEPINSLTIIKQLRGVLTDRKKRINYELAKQIFVGSHSEQGLLSIVLNSPNQLIVLEGLQLLLDYLSPQTNRDHEMFLRILSRCQPSQLVLGQIDPISADSLLKISYFRLINLYLQWKGESALSTITEEYDTRDILCKQYTGWQRLHRMGSLV